MAVGVVPAGAASAVTTPPTGPLSVAIAIQTNTGSIWVWPDVNGARDLHVHAHAGTSPAIALIDNGVHGWEVVYEASDSSLHAFSSTAGADSSLHLGMR